MGSRLYTRSFLRAWCAGILAAAILLRLLLVPGLAGRLRAVLGSVRGSRVLLGTILLLETGAVLPRAGTGGAGGTEGTGERILRSAQNDSYVGSGVPDAPDREPAEGTGDAAEDPEETGDLAEEPGDLTKVTQERVLPSAQNDSAVGGGVPDAPERESAGQAGEAAETPAVEAPAAFTAAEAEAISLRGNCGYAVDLAALLCRPLGWEQTEGPRILIIHTHSCEAYTPSEGHSYTPDGSCRTLQEEASVIAVGDALEAELAALGIQAVHDRSRNDYPSYNRSYAAARERIREDLERWPSITMVIDLHRDALEEPVREVAELDGETCAKLMLVVGTDEGGLSHPHWQDNLSCALKLQALGNRACPGLFKALSLRKERFNGDLTPGSLIVEVGSTANTLPEAEASMPHLARLLAQLLAAGAQEAAGE